MADLDKIILSIIVPVYNSSIYLRTCLDSINLYREDMEVLLVDDGSSDDSRYICQEYVKKDNRFKYFYKENGGVSTTRNHGISIMKGEYVVFFDSDDIFEKNAMDLIERAINEGLDFTAFSYTTLELDGSLDEELYPFNNKILNDKEKIYDLALGTSTLNTCWGKVFKSKIIKNNEIIFPVGMKTGEDALFVLDYLEKAETMAVHNESIILYRQHMESAMKKNNIEVKLDDLSVIYDRRMKFLENHENNDMKINMDRHFFSVLTNLLLELALEKEEHLVSTYKEILKRSYVKKIIKKTPFRKVSPVFKKIEYILIKFRAYRTLVLYFQTKKRFK